MGKSKAATTIQEPGAEVAPTAVAPSVVALTHCPYRQADRLQQALTPDKMQVAFFLGAGCPMAIRIPDGTTTQPLIPNIEGLTKHVCDELTKTDGHNACTKTVIKRLCDNGSLSPTIEDIFSHIRALQDIIGAGTIDGLAKQALTDLDTEICKLVTAAVRKRLPTQDTPYHRLATWIGGIRRAFPVEVFTSNYDLLMEQALEERRVPYFDGFVGSHRTFFDITSMEQDALPARWSRLWKVHGSINWWRTMSGDIERREEGDAQDRQMIYPSHLKYDQSRRMPYLAMLDRLRSFLARGQVVLITCGYSFSDQHINDVMIQGLRGNPTAVCFALMFDARATVPMAVQNALRVPNLTVLAADGAVVGTIERSWAPGEKREHPLHGVAIRQAVSGAGNVSFALGNFSSLGEFLADQLNLVDSAAGGDNGT
ncbi:MAG: SIR2 family protein [Planctomyces sp.]|nr:SIR2 family protein [Planctomyces sp.]